MSLLKIIRYALNKKGSLILKKEIIINKNIKMSYDSFVSLKIL
uniref:Uncharacterized protein n=1 Tax=Bartonella rochalimae ATCC BAA-1498 TaxID=685782 RepID=E6YJP7_9HYPH|nr:hypothetical protein BARRO_10018 [Bartonella rochalimae ATCC BAA-1498]